MPKRNDWASRFAVSRRALDRRLLAEWERNYGDMPLEASQKPQDGHPSFLAAPTPLDDARAASEAIARAFGRPIR